MLQTKLVIRVLDANGTLLGWAEAVGVAKGDGCIRVERPTLVPIDVEGVCEYLSVHWADVNVEVRTRLDTQVRPMKVGDVLTLKWDLPAISCGPAAGGLPSVIVKAPVRIEILPASLSGNATG